MQDETISSENKELSLHMKIDRLSMPGPLGLQGRGQEGEGTKRPGGDMTARRGGEQKMLEGVNKQG